jgi:hypothetical protein
VFSAAKNKGKTMEQLRKIDIGFSLAVVDILGLL